MICSNFLIKNGTGKFSFARIKRNSKWVTQQSQAQSSRFHSWIIMTFKSFCGRIYMNFTKNKETISVPFTRNIEIICERERERKKLTSRPQGGVALQSHFQTSSSLTTRQSTLKAAPWMLQQDMTGCELRCQDS